MAGDVITNLEVYMDTDIFDTEISVANITKGYLELLASRIH
jgi:hypothetical protein